MCDDHTSHIRERKVISKIIQKSGLPLQCKYCHDPRDCHICLTCGDVVCGRGHHNIRHFNKLQHPLYISATNLSTTCSKCANESVELPEEFVANLEALLRQPKKAPTGLSNLGNTCFMNVVIQVLCHTPEMRNSILAAHSTLKEINKSLSGSNESLVSIATSDDNPKIPSNSSLKLHQAIHGEQEMHTNGSNLPNDIPNSESTLTDTNQKDTVTENGHDRKLSSFMTIPISESLKGPRDSGESPQSTTHTSSDEDNENEDINNNNFMKREFGMTDEEIQNGQPSAAMHMTSGGHILEHTAIHQSNTNSLTTPYSNDTQKIEEMMKEINSSPNNNNGNKSQIGMTLNITDETIRILKRMWKFDKDVIVPRRYLQCVWYMFPFFTRYDQHDAQEFFNILLHQFKMEFSDNSNHAYLLESPFDELFSGKLFSEVRCKRCKYTTTSEDPFVDISLPIATPEDKEATHVHLTECLQQFTAPELLGENHPYSCPKCKSLHTCSKRMAISVAPKILAIHIKRTTTKQTRTRAQQTPEVNFPIVHLDILPFMKEYQKLSQYELYAIIVHQGGHTSGHYLAYVYSNQCGCWYEVNDVKIRKVNISELSSLRVYTLFYRQRGFKVKKPKSSGHSTYNSLLGRLPSDMNHEDLEELKRIVDEKVVFIDRKSYSNPNSASSTPTSSQHSLSKRNSKPLKSEHAADEPSNSGRISSRLRGSSKPKYYEGTDDDDDENEDEDEKDHANDGDSEELDRHDSDNDDEDEDDIPLSRRRSTRLKDLHIPSRNPSRPVRPKTLSPAIADSSSESESDTDDVLTVTESESESESDDSGIISLSESDASSASGSLISDFDISSIDGSDSEADSHSGSGSDSGSDSGSGLPGLFSSDDNEDGTSLATATSGSEKSSSDEREHSKSDPNSNSNANLGQPLLKSLINKVARVKSNRPMSLLGKDRPFDTYDSAVSMDGESSAPSSEEDEDKKQMNPPSETASSNSSESNSVNGISNSQKTRRIKLKGSFASTPIASGASSLPDTPTELATTTMTNLQQQQQPLVHPQSHSLSKRNREDEYDEEVSGSTALQPQSASGITASSSLYKEGIVKMNGSMVGNVNGTKLVDPSNKRAKSNDAAIAAAKLASIVEQQLQTQQQQQQQQSTLTSRNHYHQKSSYDTFNGSRNVEQSEQEQLMAHDTCGEEYASDVSLDIVNTD